MKFSCLGSGSDGNALLICAASGITRTTVMLDCGFGLRETERRLIRLGMTPGDLSGIVVTHEHQDHVGGVFTLARRHRIPVWLSYGTYRAVRHKCEGVELHFCRDGDRFSIGDLCLSPYTVPHDAREPLQYVATDGNSTLGVLTDAGQSTPHLVRALDRCDGIFLECNHDKAMLVDSSYPYSLKKRIGGDYGHLSNETASGILREIDKSHLKRLVGGHLSLQNNTPALALAALMRGLDGHRAEVTVACQQDGFDWIDLSPV
ncbi:MAG: MBL fold metallo-hydrolase [Oxalobacteraceae bacterium]|nr:MBL fold metallo-hydrolase [Oxalobacteraceae bacterium]